MTPGFVMKRRAAWLIPLPLAVSSWLGAHCMAYWLVSPAGEHHHMGLHAESGHAYLGYTPAIVLWGLALVVAGLLLCVSEGLRGRRPSRPPTRLFVMLPPVGFVMQEHLERLIGTGAIPHDLMLEPTFVVGLALQLPFALAALLHSTLLETGPARDSIVQHSPKRVLLRFDEPVETALGSITVYDGQGERVDAGKILRPEPESVAVAINRELERGTYTVAWRVISADSDPIKGAWVFHVKEPGAQPGGIAAQVLEDTPFVTSVFYLGGRFLDFALLLACVGGVAALVFALRSASAPVRRRLFGVVAGLAGALALVSLVELGLQAAAAEGTSLGEGFRWEAISSVADTRFGHYALLRAGLAAGLCVIALVARAICSRPEAPSRFGRAGSGAGSPEGGVDDEATVGTTGAASVGAGLSSATLAPPESTERSRTASWTIPV